jgi:hypothetical protein
MSLNRVLLKLSASFIGLMILLIIINTILVSMNHQQIRFSFDIIAIIFLLRHFVSKFMIDSGRELTSNEYWKIFITLFSTAFFYKLFMVYIALQIGSISEKNFLIILGTSFVIYAGTVAGGLWVGQRIGRKPVEINDNSVELLKSDNETLLQKIIDELSKVSIDAYTIDNCKLLIKDKRHQQKALIILNHVITEQDKVTK